ncbi:GlcG/HbpS family heme-binding protein [Paenibacillus nasutitermitis]|uniref:PduO protein n=1 Tax=Paenibacillus nasutitermitis TaxID=1652958 RepID=A0A916YW11_9BACL|nr:heme-binding protein [Paenibacillus nasutitermitis]GGD64414.1 PduO protein [Paenibacillus nasutitermitis]
MRLTLEMAKILLMEGEKKAKEMGLAADIAVVDDGGNLIAFYRMDHARIGGINISQNKAWTSVALQTPTANLAQAAQPGGPSFGINTTNNGRIVILGGGIPLTKEGRIIGGIGVSGGTSAQDVEVASAVVKAFDNMHGTAPTRSLQARIGSITQFS